MAVKDTAGNCGLRELAYNTLGVGANSRAGAVFLSHVVAVEAAESNPEKDDGYRQQRGPLDQ